MDEKMIETTEQVESTETTAANEQATPTAEKTFTQKDLDAIIDKRLARERTESEKRIQQAVTEAQKLAKMNAEERMEHERQARESALKEREADITKRELRAEAKSQLSEKGLPVELAEVLPYIDADGTSAALLAVEKVFRAAVEKGVMERLKGTAPKVGVPAPVQVEKPEDLTYQERAALYQKDPAAFKKLYGERDKKWRVITL